MNKASPPNKLYELKASKASESDFIMENMALAKNKKSNHIVKFKLFSNNNMKPSRNFLPKPIIESEKDISNDFSYESQNNYIFLYYEATIEHLKKCKKIYNNNISNIKNNFNNNKDKSINEEKNVILSNINTNININSDLNNNKNENYLILNNTEIENFYSKNGMDILYTNKIRESKINFGFDDPKKINVNINEEKSKDNLNENKNKNLMINIDYPPFKPSTLKDKKKNIEKENNNSNITPKSSSNTIIDSSEYNSIKNDNDEYLTEMFGKKGWICILCNNFNYETRNKCNRCGEIKNPKKINNLKFKMKKDKKYNNQNDNQNKDWICSYCKNFNYSFRNICNKCNIPKTIQIVYNYNPTIYNYIKNNYASYQAQPFLLFNNFQNIYINNIANFMCK